MRELHLQGLLYCHSSQSHYENYSNAANLEHIPSALFQQDGGNGHLQWDPRLDSALMCHGLPG